MTNNNTNNNTQVDTWEIYDDEDKDDLFAAPSSPPPLHITESYYHIHSARPMKHEYPYLDDKKQKSILQNNIDKVTQGHFPINTKQLLSFIFRKNNILAIITVLSKIWRERTTIQKAGKSLHLSIIVCMLVI
ncbi:hypothetical protein BDB01DRAFT_117343 [Pilobolus umbonatus]|nr:hypothetical protein BDB01DRAFT_117343 [Pilobolus umbonatus]